VLPTSTKGTCHASNNVPKSAASPTGGTSTTTGPSLVLVKNMTYRVEVSGVVDWFFPSRKSRPVQDVAVMRLGIAEETLPHHVEADDGHAPDGGIHCAAFQRAFRQFRGT